MALEKALDENGNPVEIEVGSVQPSEQKIADIVLAPKTQTRQSALRDGSQSKRNISMAPPKS